MSDAGLMASLASPVSDRLLLPLPQPTEAPPPGSRLVYVDQPGLVTVKIPPRRDPRRLRALSTGVGATLAGLAAWVILGLPVAGYLTTAPILGVLLYGVNLRWDREREELAAREQLDLNPRSLVISRSGDGLSRRVVLAGSQVRTLVVREVDGSTDLCLATPDDTLRFARGLSRDELDWLRMRLNRPPRPASAMAKA